MREHDPAAARQGRPAIGLRGRRRAPSGRRRRDGGGGAPGGAVAPMAAARRAMRSAMLPPQPCSSGSSRCHRQVLVEQIGHHVAWRPAPRRGRRPGRARSPPRRHSAARRPARRRRTGRGRDSARRRRPGRAGRRCCATWAVPVLPAIADVGERQLGAPGGAGAVDHLVHAARAPPRSWPAAKGSGAAPGGARRRSAAAGPSRPEAMRAAMTASCSGLRMHIALADRGVERVGLASIPGR